MRRAAVLGSPVAHSRSPQLHLAAYAALGLTGWTYDRLECDSDGVAPLVASCGPEWVGLSVTMPGKLAALAVADTATERARAVGAANTLVRTDDGWHADCTDVDGITGALDGIGALTGLAGARAVVLGAGGTARAVLVALAAAGVAEVHLVVREQARAGGAVAAAERAGLPVRTVPFEVAAVRRVCVGVSVVVSTVPVGAAEDLTPALVTVPRVLDVLYDPWPTPLARAVGAAGGAVAGGLDVLLHQAYGQVELFTGMPAPRAVMAAALG